MKANRLPGTLTVLAVAGITLLVLLLYAKWIFFLGWMNPLFDSLYIFIGGYLLCMGLVVAALIWGKPSIPARIGMTIGVILALAFPFLSSMLYPEHQLYTGPAAGYEMQWVTQPGDSINNALKAMQRDHEHGWCSYALYGWSTDNILYYRSSCEIGYWSYDPVTKKAQWTFWMPEEIKNSSVVASENSVVGQGMIDERFPGFDSSTPYPVIVYSSATSPDGEWLAATIREFYGPHDVVILRSE